MNMLVPAMLLLACQGQNKNASYQCCNSPDSIIVETENKLSIMLRLVESAYIDSCYFTGHVYTPVCEEDICYPIRLDVKWDLLGYFKDYRTPAGSPLTKFDHEPFTDSDHLRMRTILSDKHSVLRHIKVEDLIDKNITVSSVVKVDGVTGATRASLKDAVVGGAIYSTYTLWRLVNGVAADSIRKKTESRLDSTLLTNFLRSGNSHYQYFALERLSDMQARQMADDIIRLIRLGEGNVPFFAYNRLPPDIWNDAAYHVRLISMIGPVDFKLKNAILNQLSDRSLSSVSLDSLISRLNGLTNQQLIKALVIIERNVRMLTPDAISGLKFYQSKTDNGEVAELASRILTLWNKTIGHSRKNPGYEK